MNAETLAALQGSIKHWEENVKKVKNGEMPIISVSRCNLCNMFFSFDENETCLLCPVKKVSKEIRCKNTPYTKINDIMLFNRPKSELLPACEAELAFLRSLLPTKEVKS